MDNLASLSMQYAFLRSGRCIQYPVACNEVVSLMIDQFPALPSR